MFESLGEPELAERAYRAALKMLAKQGAGRHAAETYRAYGKFLRLRSREAEALDAFERAADLAVGGAGSSRPVGDVAPSATPAA